MTVAWGAKPHQPRILGAAFIPIPDRASGRGSPTHKEEWVSREERSPGL